jgi:hypothetical protein
MRDEQVEVDVDGYQTTTTGQTRNEAGWRKEGKTEKKERKGGGKKGKRFNKCVMSRVSGRFRDVMVREGVGRRKRRRRGGRQAREAAAGTARPAGTGSGQVEVTAYMQAR